MKTTKNISESFYNFICCKKKGGLFAREHKEWGLFAREHKEWALFAREHISLTSYGGC
jgi:hypothetical protein